jgi:hypothetical protein
METLLI